MCRVRSRECEDGGKGTPTSLMAFALVMLQLVSTGYAASLINLRFSSGSKLDPGAGRLGCLQHSRQDDLRYSLTGKTDVVYTVQGADKEWRDRGKKKTTYRGRTRH